MAIHKNTTRYLVILALCTAIIFVQQVAFAWLPNIELVSLLVIIYTLTFRHKVLYIIYAFVLLEGVTYGFNLWWVIPYLYVWTILAGVAWLFRSMRSSLGWAVLSGVFGLLFGALCAIPYLFIGGPATAFAYWVSGIPFDIAHCAGNFLLCLLLWKPLYKLLTERLKLQ